MKKSLRKDNTTMPEDTTKEGSDAKTEAPVSVWREVGSMLLVLAVAVLIAYFIKLFIIQPYIVDGASMEPTLQDHDRLLVDKLPETFGHISGHAYAPRRGDIIIFNQANLPGYIGTKQLVKRVIGLPGDRVVIKDGAITIYNSASRGGFNPDKVGGYSLGANATAGSVDTILAKDEVFVCGDNRNNSEDSRYFGPVKLNQIVGKLSFRIFPLNKVHHY